MQLKDRKWRSIQQTATIMMLNIIYMVVKRPTTVLAECPRLLLPKKEINIAFHIIIFGEMGGAVWNI